MSVTCERFPEFTASHNGVHEKYTLGTRDAMMDAQFDKRAAHGAQSLPIRDQKDLEKFTKVLILKTAQIIVESRRGLKIKTHCRPNVTGTDWFNLSIQDCVQVNEATKKAFLGDPITCSRLPLCVEISLRTADGDEMVLETWTLSFRPEVHDPAFKIMCTVYYRMGILLKSLISISRLTPAYKLSRKQGADSYVIFYHMYTGDPNLKGLGDDYKKIQVGQLSTPIGTISLKLNYRTKMTITPSNTRAKESIIVKSDHFHTDLSSDNVRNKTKKETKDKKVIDLSKPMRAGAFVDVDKIKELHDSLSLQLPPEPPMQWLLAEQEKLERKKLEERKLSSVEEGCEDEHGAGEGKSGPRENTHSKAIQMPRSSRHGGDDRKLLKVLNCPFADGSPIADLAQFYRDCVNAPLLSDSTSGESCSEDVDSTNSTESHSADDQLASLSKQLLMFESSIPEFDSVIASMYTSSSEN